ncbi:hypothetical protein PLANPX_3021 [Lacipirellula parvula]|uniref:Uncharacterized protein n=2 Tax=Lacipirellula parvula TaxID=2650471 RepID=A0A5K7XKF6_9BACT|nr:hypothetical protein PLANPX_3021 [Lacipirellula parvula]
MTPEKLAFINGQSKSTVVQTPTSPPKEKKRTIDIAESRTKSRTEKDAPSRQQRATGRPPHGVPSSSEVLDQMLVPVTIRLSHRVANALRRAHLEQRLNHAKPDTQQEIVEEAIFGWLTKQGFLE